MSQFAEATQTLESNSSLSAQDAMLEHVASEWLVPASVSLYTFVPIINRERLRTTGKVVGTTWPRSRFFVKFELTSYVKRSFVEQEIHAYTLLEGCPGIPKLFWRGSVGDWSFLLLDHVGDNIQDLCDKLDGEAKTNFIANSIQGMVGRLRGIHERGLIHGDVKPHNFCVPYRRSTLYAIDFEMTTAYPTKGGSFYGTAYWASVHALRKEPLSRRDDMHSLAYTLVGLIKETLPWENVVNDLDELTRVKASTTALELCDGLPQPCLEFVSHCLDLEFLQSPDYDFLSDCMQRLVS